MSKGEVEIEKFLQEQKSKNTQYKTKSDLNAWKKFCESQKESRAIEKIPANVLDLLLSKFFVSVCMYELGTLSGFQQSFQKEAAKHVQCNEQDGGHQRAFKPKAHATTSQDAQLNFTKLFEVTVLKQCQNQKLLFISP